MHSIRVDIEDSIFDKVIYFLNNLPINKVKIIDTSVSAKSIKPKKLNAVKLQTKDFQFDREDANAR
jgi:hypothetical protein